MVRCDPLGPTGERTWRYRRGASERGKKERRFGVLPNGPGIELPAARELYQDPSGGRPADPPRTRAAVRLGDLAGPEVAAGQLQCLVRRPVGLRRSHR